MGTVYLALDRKHGRRVALKVLPPELAAALGPERFLREIAIAARLSHPHILPLHDSGQAAGMLYYVMPHVDGESLRQRIAREGRLAFDDAIRIAREVCDAMSYAHAAGVVHRDIKPENILLSGDHALLADFGVALAVGGTVRQGLDGKDVRITDSGLPIGTAAYASPEQAAGSRVVDRRSDIYSLGCVLFEMLVGDSLRDGLTAQDLLERRFTAPLPPVRSLRPSTPAWVDQAIGGAVAQNPADRYATAEQFRDELAPRAVAIVERPLTRSGEFSLRRRLVWMGVGALMLALVGAALAFLPRHGSIADPKQVVVAGFENKTGDSALGSVGDIAADYIARGLAATRLLHEVYDVRAMARETGQPDRPATEVGRTLARNVGAGTLLSGSYYRDGDSLHFEARLLDPASGRVILPLEPAVGSVANRVQLVELLRQRVMAGFGAVFQSPGFEPWEAQSVPPTYDAYREFLEGSRAAWQFDFDRAAGHFRRAAAFDSTYLGAKAALALVLEEGGDCAAVDSIDQLLQPAVDRLASADRGSLDYAKASCRGDLAGALEASRTAMEASTGSIGFTILASIMALELFRPREALTILKRLEPRQNELTGSPAGMYWDFKSMAYHQLGEYRRELDGEAGRGRALAGLGRITELSQLLDTLLLGGDAEGAQCVALELRAHGHPKDAQQALKRIVTWLRAHSDVDPATLDHNPCLWIQLSAPYHAGLFDEARSQYERLAVEDTASVKVRAALGALAVRRDDPIEVSRIDQWLAAHRAGSRGRATYARARLAALSGDRERAVVLLRQAFSQGLTGRMTVHIDPDFESLRDYPPYQELMRPKG